MIYNLFLKFQMRHEGFSFYGLRESDEGGDTDLIYNFCWPYIEAHWEFPKKND